MIPNSLLRSIVGRSASVDTIVGRVKVVVADARDRFGSVDVLVRPYEAKASETAGRWVAYSRLFDVAALPEVEGQSIGRQWVQAETAKPAGTVFIDAGRERNGRFAKLTPDPRDA